MTQHREPGPATSFCPNIWLSRGPLLQTSHAAAKGNPREPHTHNPRPAVWGEDAHPALVLCSQHAPPDALFLTGPQASGIHKAWGRGIPGQTKSLGQGAACCRPTVVQCLHLPQAHSGLLFPDSPFSSAGLGAVGNHGPWRKRLTAWGHTP